MTQSKKVTRNGNTTLTINFELDYASQIVLKVYDQSGTLMRMNDFGWRLAYTTDLEGRVAYGKRSTVHDVYSASNNWNPGYMIPVILVPLNSSRVINVLYEVPHFGKVVLKADNNGQGFTSKVEGETREINLSYELGKTHYRIANETYRLYARNGYAISENVGELLKRSQNELNQASREENDQAKAKYSDQALSSTLKAAELLELEKAQADIETNRKGRCTVTIVGPDGTPLSNVRVAYRQVGHDFLFGAFDWNYDQTTLSLMRKAGINYLTIYYNWGTIESNINGFGRIDQFVNYANRNDMKACAHNLLYFTDIYNFDSYPPYLKRVNCQETRRRLQEFVSSSIRRDGGKVVYWNIMNEANSNWANALNFTSDQMLTIMDDTSKTVRRLSPKAKIIINFAFPGGESEASRYDLEDVYAYTPYEFIEMMDKKGIDYDILGLQFYYGTMYPETGWPSRDMYSISKMMDWYAKYGKPVFITETSFPSQFVRRNGLKQGYWHGMPSEETKADYIRYFYTIAFSKPHIHAIAWWDGDDTDCWYPTAGLITTDHKIKLAYTTLANLISNWTTAGSALTDKDGKITFKGYAGDYQVIISAEGQEPMTVTIHIDEQGDASYTFTLKRTLPEDTTPSLLYLSIAVAMTAATALGVLGTRRAHAIRRRQRTILSEYGS